MITIGPYPVNGPLGFRQLTYASGKFYSSVYKMCWPPAVNGEPVVMPSVCANPWSHSWQKLATNPFGSDVVQELFENNIQHHAPCDGITMDPHTPLHTGCGFYAHWNFEENLGWRTRWPPSDYENVMVLIEGSGAIGSYERGFRAEFARVVAVVGTVQPDASVEVRRGMFYSTYHKRSSGQEILDVPMQLTSNYLDWSAAAYFNVGRIATAQGMLKYIANHNEQFQ